MYPHLFPIAAALFPLSIFANSVAAQQESAGGSIPGNRGELITPLVPGPPTYTDPREGPGKDTAFEARPRRTPACDDQARNYLNSTIHGRRPLHRRALYQNWLASNVIGSEVKRNGKTVGELQDIFVGPDGTIAGITVETGGFLEFGDRVFRVSWPQVRVSQDGISVDTPTPAASDSRRRESFDEKVPAGPDEYRVSAVTGDWTRIPIEGCSIHHGELADVVFSPRSQIVAVIENRVERLGGGTFAYPFDGYVDGWKRFIGHYDLPPKRGGRPGIAVDRARFSSMVGGRKHAATVWRRGKHVPAAAHLSERAYFKEQIEKGWHVSPLLGRKVVTRTATELGRLRDVLVNASGDIVGVVVAGQGTTLERGQQVRISWHQIDQVKFPSEIVLNAAAMPDARGGASSTSEAAREPGELAVTELFGDYARVQSGRAFGYVSDLIFSNGGTLQAILVQRDQNGGTYAVPFRGWTGRWLSGMSDFGLPYATLGRAELAAHQMESGTAGPRPQ